MEFRNSNSKTIIFTMPLRRERDLTSNLPSLNTESTKNI